LAIGIGRYRHADASRFRNLRFPTRDAQAVATRFQREGAPLYSEPPLVRLLVDEEATLAGIRTALKQLKHSVRPGQIDTVVLYLSGHGVSLDGRYFFATHDTDLKDVTGTALSGRELREALGGEVTAKAMFLFVDTCHAGGLGGRNDDLAFEVQAGKGVYLLASSGASGQAFESPVWEHGAFTRALLETLGKRELAQDGVIYFNALVYAVPEGVAGLLKAAGRSESEQQPCIPQVTGPLRVPLVQAR
jgi:hypothetical protein